MTVALTVGRCTTMARTSKKKNLAGVQYTDVINKFDLSSFRASTEINKAEQQ